MAQQLPLPLATRVVLTRQDFVPSLASAPALAFLDSWPNGSVAVAALHGPSGAGKSHLCAIWADRVGAAVASVGALQNAAADCPLVIEDIDGAAANAARDASLFALLERAHPERPLLLTGLLPPTQWPVVLPDLASRFSALLSFPLWAPDDALLAAIARKLFNDRQLAVPDAVIEKMVLSLERSPAAMRDFVAEADAKALSEGRAVNLPLVREMLAKKS